MVARRGVPEATSTGTFSVVIEPSNRVAFSVKPDLLPKTTSDETGIAPKMLPPSAATLDVIRQSRVVDKTGERRFRLMSDDTEKSSVSVPELPREKAFTRRAKQTIRSAGGALEKEGFTQSQFFFFTGTLPGSLIESMEMMARYSRFIVNRLKQRLRDYEIDLTINTWEWQKRGALHLHLIYVCVDELLGQKLAYALKELWLDLLDQITKESGVDMYARNGFESWTRDSQPVRERAARTIQCEVKPGSSVVAYLSKYLSKEKSPDKGEIQRVKELPGQVQAQLFYPSSWWSVSMAVRQLIIKHTRWASVRLPMRIAEEYLIEVSESLIPLATLALNPFSLEAYPGYIFRDIYVNAHEYEDVCAYLDAVVGMRPGVESGQARIDKNLAKRWLDSGASVSIQNRFEVRYGNDFAASESIENQRSFVLEEYIKSEGQRIRAMNAYCIDEVECEFPASADQAGDLYSRMKRDGRKKEKNSYELNALRADLGYTV